MSEGIPKTCKKAFFCLRATRDPCLNVLPQMLITQVPEPSLCESVVSKGS